MKTNTLNIFIFIFSLVANQSFSQATTCDGTLPFEEKNGLLTIEIESGIINDDRWKIASEIVNGEEITYLHWTGSQSFNALTGVPITYRIKINTPGTYRFAWRMRVGLGTSKGEHNDSWLKIDGEDFYGIKNGNKVYPKPLCSSDPSLTCAEGSSTQNFIKAFGNRLDWGFVTNTNDGDSHRVFVTFNEAKEYTITVDARSSYQFVDKMVLRRDGISDGVAFNLSNSESDCYKAPLSDKTLTRNQLSIYPNPTSGKLEIRNIPENSSLIVTDVLGRVVQKLTTRNKVETLDISSLKNGIYYISNHDKANYFVKKVIKI